MGLKTDEDDNSLRKNIAGPESYNVIRTLTLFFNRTPILPTKCFLELLNDA